MTIPPIYITCDFMGGLGNQMFQVAHAIAQAKKNNLPTLFRTTSYTPLQGKQTLKYKNSIFSKLTFNDNIKPTYTVKEKEWAFNPINELIIRPTSFFGYYQSDKNFYGYDDLIRDTFLPKKETMDDLTIEFPELNEGVTCIHVRRGDYLKSPNVHPTIDEGFIKEGLKHLTPQKYLMIFSDDIEWCKNNLSGLSDNLVFVDGDFEDYEEIWLMSNCNNYIISNSTFSWWGAFLNKNNPEVVAPSKWFGPNGPTQNYKDIYRNNWILL